MNSVTQDCASTLTPALHTLSLVPGLPVFPRIPPATLVCCIGMSLAPKQNFNLVFSHFSLRENVSDVAKSETPAMSLSLVSQ